MWFNQQQISTKNMRNYTTYLNLNICLFPEIAQWEYQNISI